MCIIINQLKLKKMITCIKNIKAKKGFEFIKGNEYNATINNGEITIYFSQFEFATIKNVVFFEKYFKF